MTEQTVLYEERGRIAIITLNRPESLNAINLEMRQGIRDAWLRFKESEDQWVAILTGAGIKSFCAGMDLKPRSQLDPSSGSIEKIREKQGPFLPRDLGIFKPTIAAVNGFALAGGFALVQNCDLCVAAETAEFAITEPRWNLPASWAADLTRQVGLRNALEMTLLPRRVPAQRAREMGFVNWVVPQEQLMDKALEVANLILENAPAAVRAFVEMFHRTYGMSHDDAVTLGDHIQKHLRSMEDTVEGPRAFAEKRKPNFQNK